MDNDAPCAMGAQRPPVDTTGRPGGPAHRPRTAVRLPKFSGVNAAGAYLAQFRLAAWHNGWCTEEAVVHLALALEGTAARVLLDLDQADQRDLQALIRALERRLATRNSLRATREALALHAFLRGLQPESLGQHVRLTEPQTLDAALDQADGLRRSSAAVHPWTRLGQRPPPATKHVERKDRVRTATLPATKTAEASRALWRHDRADFEPQHGRSLGLVEELRLDGAAVPTHPRPSRRRGRRKARRRRAAEDGGCPNGAQSPLQKNLVGAPEEVVPDTLPGPLRTVGDGRPQPGGRLHRNGAATGWGQGGGCRPPEQSGLCSGVLGRRDV
ncbi:unnamed protein product [Boreogadus saida]